MDNSAKFNRKRYYAVEENACLLLFFIRFEQTYIREFIPFYL